MRHYETTFVIDSLLKAEEIDAIISKYERFITTNGGEILRIDRWGKRRLAFEIKKRQYGFYVYIRFSAPSNIPRLLEREYRLNENVLRYLTLMMDKKALAQEAKNLKEMKAAGPRVEISAIDNDVLVTEPDLNFEEEIATSSDLIEENRELNLPDVATEVELEPALELDSFDRKGFLDDDNELISPTEQDTVPESEPPAEPKPE